MLGLENAKNLVHGSTLIGVQSGVQYMIKRYPDDELPWKLVHYYGGKVWGQWKTKETMIKELANCDMRPICLW